VADFIPAYEKMIKNEGGYQLHTVEGDRGGMTYAGIARNFHETWPGWRLLDNGRRDDPGLTVLVKDFYRSHFWGPVKGDDITAQATAETLFDCAVNMGHRTAIKLAQLVLETTPDGILGPVTLEALNNMADKEFVLRYAIAKVARYAEICNRNRSQSKFLLGWINRTLKGVTA